ncbi:MAG: hypothetical protein ACRDZO_03955 [Egibacteraceae bacterium]
MNRFLTALAGLLLLTGCARLGGEEFQASHSDAVLLGATVGQTFRPVTSAVRGLDLLTATYGQDPDPDGRLRVTLFDGQRGKRLATATVSGDRIGDNDWVPLRFDPPVPAPEIAEFTVTWEGDTPLGLRANVPPRGFDRREQDPNNPYPGGQLRRNGAAAYGDLAFRVLGTGGTGEAITQLTGMFRSAGDRLIHDELPFTVVWLTLLTGAIALAIVGFRHKAA